MTDITTKPVSTARLKQIAHAIADGNYREPDRDADLVISAAADEIDRLRADVAGLRAFARSVMDAWPYGDVDGGFLQELAIKHGLIELKDPMPTEPCCDDCECAGMVTPDEFAAGVECYRKTALLLGSK